MKTVPLIFFFLLYPSLLVIAKENARYEGPIHTKVVRIREAKPKINGLDSVPLNWEFYFKERNGNYAVFYDLNGDEAYFQFRRNKFDIDGDNFASKLIPGNAYNVTGQYLGAFVFPDPKRGVGKYQKGENSISNLQNQNTIFVYQLKEYYELHSKQIIY